MTASLDHSRPLRILTVANVPPDANSGAAGTVWYTNQGLRELGHNVDELWTEQLGPRRIAHGNLHALIEQPAAYRRAVLKAVRHRDYDVIQMSQPQGWLAARALKSAGFRGLTVNRSHGVELRVNEVLPAHHQRLEVPESRFPVATKLLQRYLERQWSRAVKWFDRIVVGCSQDRECLVRRLGVTNVSVIPHGVRDDYLQCPVANTKLSGIRMLHVGQYAFFKGSVLLIKILNEFLRKHPELSFTWVCSASHHTLIREQLAASILDQVQLLDWMDQGTLKKTYDDHNVFVFPSLFEGFGKAPFEAMARGLCVVASDEGGMHDLIDDQVDGMICPVGETSAFVDRLDTLVANQRLVQEFGEAARKRVQELSWNRCAAEYEKLYLGQPV